LRTFCIQRATRATAEVSIGRMLVLAQVGLLTTLLEVVATSIATGTVAGGFLAAGHGMITGRIRREVEGDAFRNVFWGGFGGILCLSYDLLTR